jgi:hypothetical protein
MNDYDIHKVQKLIFNPPLLYRHVSKGKYNGHETNAEFPRYNVGKALGRSLRSRDDEEKFRRDRYDIRTCWKVCTSSSDDSTENGIYWYYTDDSLKKS